MLGAGDGVGQIGEHAAVVVVHGRDFAVHQLFGADDAAAEGFADGLVAEAHAQNRQPAREMPYRLHRHARFFGRAGAGADHEILRREGGDFFKGDAVVAAYQHFLSEFAEVLDDVVGEAVVVVDKE